MRAEIARVVAGAVDEGRLASSQELYAHQVHAGCIADDTAVVTHAALAVQNRHLEVRVVGPEPGRPKNCADVAPAEIKRKAR